MMAKSIETGESSEMTVQTMISEIVSERITYQKLDGNNYL